MNQDLMSAILAMNSCNRNGLAVATPNAASVALAGGAFTREHSLTAAIILVCGLLAGCSEQCVPAETVRVKIQNTVYRLPASFQPSIHGRKKNFPTRDTFQGGIRIQQYCQKPDDPPFAADTIILGRQDLDRIVAQRPELSQLRGLDIVSLIYAPASRQPAEKASGSLMSGGLFRRVDHKGSFELFSTGPLMFGSPIRARCGRAPTRERANSCTIWGQIEPGTLINVHLIDTTHPIGEWPRTLGGVEQLIRSVGTP